MRAYSRSAWELCAELPVSLGWDVLDQVAVRRAGLAVEVDPAARAWTARTTGSSVGLVAGRRRLGMVCRLTGYSRPYVLLKLLRTLGQRPLVAGGLAFISGYLRAGESPFPAGLLEAHRREQRARLRQLLRRPVSGARRLYPSS